MEQNAINELRNQILTAADIKVEKVHVPEWGLSVYVKQMNGKERSDFEANSILKDAKGNMTGNTDVSNFRARLFVNTVCGDPEGKTLLFSEADVPAISAKSAKALDRISKVAMRLNGISKEDEETIAKNSLEIQSDVSG